MGRAISRKPSLPKKWLKLAESQCKKKGARLTPARLAAYTELVASNQPLSAYELLALMEKRENRKIAPLSAYRHLDFLISVGLVHKLESAQSYMPCMHPGHEHTSQYLLCSTCEVVTEVESKKFENLLDEMADAHGFHPTKAVGEVSGFCAGCSKKAPAL